MKLISHEPIKTEKEDLFNFKHFATKVRNLIQKTSNNPEPVTIGIYGSWGEGKTSFLNLIERGIDLWEKKDNQRGVLKYHFNPWRYSSEEAMLFDFFEGLSRLMFVNKAKNSEKIGNLIKTLSRYLKSIKISHTIGIPKILNTKVVYEPSKILEELGEDVKGKKLTLENIVSNINEALNGADYKVVVFIDDVDRLDKDEIYTILKLIKLNANFNHFIYLITLDKEQTAKAISKRYGSNKKDGALFLEKIITLPIYVPRIEMTDLKNFFEVKLNQVKNNLELKDLIKKDKEFSEILKEYQDVDFKTPREIIRILNSFFVGAFAVGDEINLRDLFWLEVLKSKNENCYNLIKKYYLKGAFTRSDIIDFNDNLFNEDGNTRKEIFDRFPKSIPLVIKIFPGRNKLKKGDVKEIRCQKRVNYFEYFDIYFSYHINGRVSNISILKIKEDVIQENNEELLKTFKSIKDTQLPHKLFFLIDKLISEIKFEENILFFIRFIFQNINLIPNSELDIQSKDYRGRIIESCAYKLKVEYRGKSEGNILSICEYLNVSDLAMFRRVYKEHRVVSSDFDKLITEKAKTYVENNLLYEKPLENRFVLYYWSQYERDTFRKYINSTLISEKRLKLLIRNFVSFYNNEFYGGFTLGDFDHVNLIFDVDFFYQKVKEYRSDIIEEVVEIEGNYPDRYAKSTEEDNIRQFVFWYKYRQTNKK